MGDSEIPVNNNSHMTGCQGPHAIPLKMPLPTPVKGFVIFLLPLTVFSLVGVMFYVLSVFDVTSLIGERAWHIFLNVGGLRFMEGMAFINELVWRAILILEVRGFIGHGTAAALIQSAPEIFLLPAACLAALCIAAVAAIHRRSRKAGSLCKAVLVFCILLCVFGFLLGFLLLDSGGDRRVSINLMGRSVLVCIACAAWLRYFRHTPWCGPELRAPKSTDYPWI